MTIRTEWMDGFEAALRLMRVPIHKAKRLRSAAVQAEIDDDTAREARRRRFIEELNAQADRDRDAYASVEGMTAQ